MNVAVPGRPDVYLERVAVVWSPAEPGEWGMPAHYTVGPVWAGVDRPYVGGTACKTKKLADRLAAAILAGVAIGTPELCVDNAGQTYVNASSKCLARMLNADLRRLGY